MPRSKHAADRHAPIQFGKLGQVLRHESGDVELALILQHENRRASAGFIKEAIQKRDPFQLLSMSEIKRLIAPFPHPCCRAWLVFVAECQ